MIWVLAIVAVPLTLGVLTGIGSRRRHQSLAVAGVSAVFFPIAWAVWYVQDEHPYAR